MPFDPASFVPERRTQRIALAASSGLLLAAGFPPVPAGVTALAGFIPFFLLMRGMRSAAQAFRYAYLTFLVMNLGTIWWISAWWGEDPWLKAAGVAVNLVHPLLFTLPSLAYHVISRRLGERTALLTFPFVWIAYEWLAQLPELSFPWLVLANTLTYTPQLLQYLPLTGTFGASLWITAVNVTLFFGITAWRGGGPRMRRLRIPVLALAGLALVPAASYFAAGRDDGNARTVRAAVTQPDVDPYEKWGEGETPIGKIRNLTALYDSAAAVHPDVILMPETAIPFLLLQPSYDEEWRWLRSHVDSVGIPLLTGFADIRWYEKDAPATARKVRGEDAWYETFNSTLMLLPGQRRLQVYHKSRLTPLSERIPYLEYLPFLKDALSWGVGISNWGLGNDTTVFDLPARAGTVRTWAMICYETLYPSFVAGFAGRGAEFYGVVTNDGWFGNSSGPYQLERYTVLRAIETRRAVARCANNGISCFITPHGRVEGETRFGTRTWTWRDIPLRTDITPYVRYGDWIAMLAAAVTALALAAAVFTARRT